MIKNISLAKLADISFGLYAPNSDNGEIPYLQARQFDLNGNRIENASEYLALDARTAAHLLRDGDVIFVGKGSRIFAWCYREFEGPYIASSIFFVLRPDQKKIYAEYLVAILNAPQSKATFQQIGSGTNIFSIRKSELGAFEIPLPSMQQQKRIADLAGLHSREIELTQQIIKQKQIFYTAIISKLIK